jgi:hypothetical protein
MGALPLLPEEGDVRKLKLIAAAVVAIAMLAVPGAAMAKDRDHDKMPDKWEKAHGLSVHKKNAKGDPDRDGLSNRGEFRSSTDPRDADTDDDGTEDGDEDRDRDRVDNANEIREHTRPRDRDTDDDGVRDGAEDTDGDHLKNAGEDEFGTDPEDRDTDGDGRGDACQPKIAPKGKVKLKAKRTKKGYKLTITARGAGKGLVTVRCRRTKRGSLKTVLSRRTHLPRTLHGTVRCVTKPRAALLQSKSDRAA